MKHKRFISSLMGFNSRVLNQGYVKPGVLYNISNLKELLFFNNVYISNCRELYERHDIHNIHNMYKDNMTVITANMDNIIRILNSWNCQYKVEPLYESVYSISSKIIFTKLYSFDIEDERFIPGVIYISVCIDNHYIIADISNVTNDDISSIDDDTIIYYDRTLSIMQYIKEVFNASAVVSFMKICNEFTYNTSRVDVSSIGEDDDVVELIYNMGLFGKNLIMNDYLDTSHLDMIFDKLIPVENSPHNKQNITIDNIFARDMLLEYPRDSYAEYIMFIRDLIHTRYLTVWRMTLYRVGNDTNLYNVIKEARRCGVTVIVNIELCASGELINKVWMEKLESIGVLVYTYKSGKIKVHTKLMQFEMISGDLITQIGTGNYHVKTSKEYCDLSMITLDQSIGKQVRELFNLLMGNEYNDFNNDVLVTRNNARDMIIRLISEQGSKGDDGYISIKCNALDDPSIITSLDEAAAKGCTIELCIRGVCTWVPDYGRVVIKSLVWNKLEHSRMYCFGIQDPRIYIGSLDMVTNKLDNRIEVLVEVTDANIKSQCIDYMNGYNGDVKHSWIMTNNGMYIKESDIVYED